MRTVALLFCTALALAATGTVDAAARTFGAAMPAGEARPLSGAIASGDAGGAPVKVSGRVTEVCRKEGCWMVLADGADYARVRMGDHAFAVPTDASGSAVVYGILAQAEVSPAAAAHLEHDGASAPDRREYRIEASSVQLLD